MMMIIWTAIKIFLFLPSFFFPFFSLLFLCV